MNWLVMEYPDEHNDGIVVYSRGTDFRLDPEQPVFGYSNFIREGTGRFGKFIISQDQAIFHPIIMDFVDENNHQNASTRADRLNHLVTLKENGDDPPLAQQARISENGNAYVPINPNGYREHGFISERDFTLEIPPQDYSNITSLCTLLDVPLTRPGPSKCRVAGYFILLTFDPGSYIITTQGNGEMEYQTRTYIEIEVTQNRNQRNASRLLNQLAVRQLRQGVRP